jgi:hypothetical protein
MNWQSFKNASLELSAICWRLIRTFISRTLTVIGNFFAWLAEKVMPKKGG